MLQCIILFCAIVVSVSCSHREPENVESIRPSEIYHSAVTVDYEINTSGTQLAQFVEISEGLRDRRIGSDDPAQLANELRQILNETGRNKILMNDPGMVEIVVANEFRPITREYAVYLRGHGSRSYARRISSEFYKQWDSSEVFRLEMIQDSQK